MPLTARVAGALMAVVAAACPALAQQPPVTLPGLIVTVPPSGGPPPQAAPEPPQKAQPPRPAAAEPPARPKTTQPAKAKPAPVAAAPSAGSGSGGGQSIVVLVNDEPITGFEIEERTRLMSMQANVSERATENMKRLVQAEATTQRWRKIVEETVQENPGKSREQILAILEQRKAAFGDTLRAQAIASAKASVLPGLRKGAVEELLEERLKLQEAKRLNIAIDDKEVDAAVKGIADRNKMTEQQFAQQIRGMGVEMASFKARFRANMAWAEVVRRKFGHQVNVNQREIDKFLSSSPARQDEVDLQVARVLLPAAATDQRAVAQRLDEAETIRREFKGCKSLAAQVAKVTGAKYEDLGVRKPAQFAEPTRSLLLNAQDGEIVPPSPGGAGVELFALCQRKVTTADEQKRSEATSELRQKEFELMARRHLKDLRQDAHIEWRDRTLSSAVAKPVNAEN